MIAKILALFALLAVAYVTAECPAENGEDAVYLSNPDDCTTFFVCDHGQAILRPCAEGTAWNAEAQVCDWPENAGCVIEEAEEENEEGDEEVSEQGNEETNEKPAEEGDKEVNEQGNEEANEKPVEEANEKPVEEANEKPVEAAVLPPASPANFPRTA